MRHGQRSGLILGGRSAFPTELAHSNNAQPVHLWGPAIESKLLQICCHAESCELALLRSTPLYRPSRENNVREHGSIRCRGHVRTETDAHIKRFVEVECDWRAELVHGFALKADKDCNGIPMLFDSDAPGFD